MVRGRFTWKFHLTHPVIDELCRLKKRVLPPGQIKEMLKLQVPAAQCFDTYLRPKAPRPYERYIGSGARWRYFSAALSSLSGTILFYLPSLLVFGAMLGELFHLHSNAMAKCARPAQLPLAILQRFGGIFFENIQHLCFLQTLH
jgi:hypothetical protein